MKTTTIIGHMHQEDSAPPLRRPAWWTVLQRKLTPYLFISPFIIYFSIFFIWPAAYSLVLSFFRYRGYGDAHFVGTSNYISTLHYHVFWTELQNTLFYWLVHVLPLIALAFMLALFVRAKFIKGQSFFKPVIFMPQVIAIVAATLVFQNLFSTEYGFINSVLHRQIPWLQDYTLTRYVVILLEVWRGLGFWFVVFLAGLTSINPDLEEAATVDGASSWQRLRYVLLPLMRNVFLFAFVIDAIASIRLYTEPNVLAAPAGSLANPEVAPLLNLLVSDLNNGNFGQSAAVGWILFVITMIASAAQFFIFRDQAREAD